MTRVIYSINLSFVSLKILERCILRDASGENIYRRYLRASREKTSSIEELRTKIRIPFAQRTPD